MRIQDEIHLTIKNGGGAFEIYKQNSEKSGWSI